VKAKWAIAMHLAQKHPRENKAVIAFEKLKSSILTKVEYPFRVIKRQFGFMKAQYKGLDKNDNQLVMLFMLVNLFRCAWIWATLQKRLLNIPSLDYRLVGRWLGHMLRGQFVHSTILQATAFRGEVLGG